MSSVKYYCTVISDVRRFITESYLSHTFSNFCFVRLLPYILFANLAAHRPISCNAWQTQQSGLSSSIPESDPTEMLKCPVADWPNSVDRIDSTRREPTEDRVASRSGRVSSRSSKPAFSTFFLSFVNIFRFDFTSPCSILILNFTRVL